MEPTARWCPYTVATDMDSPNPDSGEEYPHTNTQLYNILSEENRFKVADDMSAPWNAPEPGQTPTMDGFVTDYISTFTAEMGRQPTYDEYSQIMTGFTPEQVPVLNGLARGFGVFDHWFCEVPSQTFMNRSFWTAGHLVGIDRELPGEEVVHRQRRRDDLRPARRTRQDLEGLRVRADADLLHRPHPLPAAEGPPGHPFRPLRPVRGRRRQRRATRLLPHRADSRDRAQRLPPGRGTSAGPRRGRSQRRRRPRRSWAGRHSWLASTTLTGVCSPTPGSNVWNTTLLIGWDEPGGTYDHVPPPAVPPPDPATPEGEYGFTFDRSGYRVPAIIVSPWVAEGDVFNEEHRHTSLIATLAGPVEPGRPLHRPRRRRPCLLRRLQPRRTTASRFVAGPDSASGTAIHPGRTGPRRESSRNWARHSWTESDSTHKK